MYIKLRKSSFRYSSLLPNLAEKVVCSNSSLIKFKIQKTHTPFHPYKKRTSSIKQHLQSIPMTSEMLSATRTSDERPVLSIMELKNLDTLFDKNRHLINCNNGQCNKSQIRRNDKDKNINPPQTKFRCRTCTKTFTAYEMQQILCKIEEGETLDTPTTQDMNFMFSDANNQGDTMTQIMLELKNQRERLDQHDTMYTELQRLRQELEQANAQIGALEETNRKLRQQITNMEQNKQPEIDHEFPPLMGVTQTTKHTNSQASQWAHPLKNRLKKAPVSPETQQRRIAAAARAFQLPSETHGFQYIYVPSRARQPTGQIRSNLRRFGVDNSRVLDIQYPSRQTIGLLVHNDYVSTLTEKLKSININTINFDPLDPKNINDPKLKDVPTEQKQQLAKELHYKRAQRSIQFIRAPIKFAVARTFHTYGWITLDELKTVLATKKPHRDDPEAAATNYRLNENDDDNMSDIIIGNNEQGQKRKQDDSESISSSKY